jgi:thioredoxin reductase (NADPH)
MPGPLLLAVEDDPEALEDVERELRDRYARSYSVLCTPSWEEALVALRRQADSADEVALVLAAQQLAGLSGGELLDRVRALHPHAKRALLVPPRFWGDRPTAEAVFDATARGRIDYFVLKPVTAPDERFHQAISTFLYEWTKARRIAPHTVHVVGEDWSGRAYELREALQRCAIPHAFCVADSPEGRELLSAVDPGAKLPLLVMPDGSILVDPTNREIAEAAGAPMELDREEYDLVIVGAGPAGLSAAVYGGSEGLRTLVVDEGGIGGQATSSSLIRNYLGFKHGISGGALAEQAYDQAWVFGVSFAFMHRASELEASGDRLVLTLSDGRRVSGRAVVLASGAAYRRLDVPELEELTGAGVYYGGPISEGHAMTGLDVYVVGGANSAGQAALYLARYARRVTVVVRAPSLGEGMSHYLVREIEATPNVQVRTETSVVGGGGDGRLEHLVLLDGGGERATVPADGLFVMIGARPHTDWLPDEIARDDRGFVLTGADLAAADGRWPLERGPLPLETSMPGVFAAGDVRRESVKRVASAVGEGSIAVQSVHRFLGTEVIRTGRSSESSSRWQFPTARAGGAT